MVPSDRLKLNIAVKSKPIAAKSLASLASAPSQTIVPLDAGPLLT